MKSRLDIDLMEIDRIHFYVVDATQIQSLLIKQMGLSCLGGTISEHTLEHLVGNSRLLFSISSPLNSASPVADYLQCHPSGVKGISFRVNDLAVIRQKVDRLNLKILASSSSEDEFPWLKIQGWGLIEHTIIQAPARLSDSNIDLDRSIIGIDHVVLNVADGELEAATTWYQNLFEFQLQQTFDIQTQTSGLTSKALVSPCGKIRFNINQPSSSNSQIQHFLDLNRGAGIQHIALRTNQICATVDRMQQQQLAFLAIDPSYYSQLKIKAKTAQDLALTAEEWQEIERLEILVDWAKSAPEAVILQIFTQPIFEVPTFFWEIIERRHDAVGFGRGNFQALFEAIEQNSSLGNKHGSRSLDVV